MHKVSHNNDSKFSKEDSKKWYEVNYTYQADKDGLSLYDNTADIYASSCEEAIEIFKKTNNLKLVGNIYAYEK